MGARDRARPRARQLIPRRRGDVARAGLGSNGDIPPHRERGGDLAFFFRSGDAEHLASTIENALQNRRSPDRLRTHATAYSWGLAADAYEKAYAQAGIGL